MHLQGEGEVPNGTLKGSPESWEPRGFLSRDGGISKSKFDKLSVPSLDNARRVFLGRGVKF